MGENPAAQTVNPITWWQAILLGLAILVLLPFTLIAVAILGLRKVLVHVMSRNRRGY